MQLALELAARGFGAVEPNPMVGCVILRDGRIIGKGWHEKFGGPHAEINAIADCRKNGFDTTGVTMFVTLEPCCHHGKTGPCTEAIINAKIAKVVVPIQDPTPQVGGKGIRQLRRAGVKVSVGLCIKQAKLLNPAFFKFAKTARPWVIVKWAQTIDGKLARRDTSAQTGWISGKETRTDAHKIRRSAQAILVGINTVIADDPLLTPRPAMGKRPLRLVLDGRLRIPYMCRLLNTISQAPVLIVTTKSVLAADKSKAKKIAAKGAELLPIPAEKGRWCNLNVLLDELGIRGVQRLLVEGGPAVISSFLEGGLADELVVYIAPKIFAAEGAADIAQAMSRLKTTFSLNYVTTNAFGRDVRIRGLLTALDEF